MKLIKRPSIINSQKDAVEHDNLLIDEAVNRRKSKNKDIKDKLRKITAKEIKDYLKNFNDYDYETLENI